MDSNRKLLEGERVEVRQKEVGLRGSWHSGVVVQVKCGRRVVEYDELLTLDGSKKLRELIPLPEDINVQSSALRNNNRASAERNKRGFIRPIPPPCLLPSPQSWTKGLLVDAFYDDAWWEGILLDYFFLGNEEVKVRIFFPEEGDELLFLIKDVRVSQEWDEASGQWAVRGCWLSGGENGDFDFGPLKSICRQRRSSLKKLWRQRRSDCVQDPWTGEQKNASSVSASLLLESHGWAGQDRAFVDLGESPAASKHTPGLKVQEGDITGSLGAQQRRERELLCNKQRSPRKDVKFLLECSAPLKSLVKQTHLSAKRFLVDAGWKVEVRNQPHNMRQEPVYVSPSGSKYYSLASACRGWKKSKNLASSLVEDTSMELNLLNSYNVPEGLMRAKPLTRQVKAAQMMQSDEATKQNAREAKKPDSPCISVEISKDGKPMNQSSDLSCRSAVQRDDLGLPLPVSDRRKSKLTPCPEKLKKRKSTGEGTEQKCKKGRSSLRKEGYPQEGKAPRGRGGCRMQVLLSSPGRQKDSSSTQNKAEPSHFKKSTVLSWLIDKGILKDNEPVCYINRKDGRVMKKGEVTREGVLCKCCKVIFTLSNFEAHAGSKLHRPSANIFLDDGRSITDCQLQACALQDAKEKKDVLVDISDDTCGVCADGGDLILCDHCPSTFHPDCIGLEVIPDGDWYCPRCSCGVCGNNKIAGEIDNTTSRCVQCELEYHLPCVPEHVMFKLDRVARETLFCGHQCEQIFVGLRRLVGIANSLKDGFSWMLLRSMKKDNGLLPSSLEVMAEHNVKLGVAHGVMQECFVPMIDPRTKIDLISQALYNKKSKVTRLNYSGFYTIILEKGDEMISVATIRIHGARLAEMPLVGTRYQYRRQGMCRRLVNALEQMLENLGVEKLVLPAVPELLDTWTGAFNFQHMSLSETRDLSKLSLMTFPGTTLLQKQLRKESCVVSICQSGIHERVDNADGLECKSVKDSLLVVGVPLDGGVSARSDAHLSVEFVHSESCEIEKMDHSSQNINIESCSYSNGPTASCLPNHQLTPRVTMEGHLDVGGGRVKIQNKFKSQAEGSGDASNDGKGKKDDDVQYARVVRATTRSKRLVKSSKWIADGLKELAKDIEESNSTIGTEANLAQGLNCNGWLEKSCQTGDGQENGQKVESASLVLPSSLVQIEEGKVTQVATEFDECIDGTMRSVMEAPVMVSSDRIVCDGPEINDLDESLNANNESAQGYHASGMVEDNSLGIILTKTEFMFSPKYYIRRKRIDKQKERAVDATWQDCVQTILG